MVKTLVERVYVDLRGDILAGRLSPGAKLPLAELVARYEATMGVVREALLRLATEGLVASEPQVGFRVTPITVTDLQELTDARCLVEGEAFRLAIVNGDLDWEARVIATHHRLSRVPQMDGDDPNRISDEWAQVHAEFHEALLSGCGNSRLLTVALSWRDTAELYRRWSVANENARDVAAEHAQLRDACISRDPDLGVESLRNHITLTTSLLIQIGASPVGQ